MGGAAFSRYPSSIWTPMMGIAKALHPSYKNMMLILLLIPRPLGRDSLFHPEKLLKTSIGGHFRRFLP
jgi:hypothetical protein